MLDHVSITISDFAAAEHFYDAIMKALDVGRSDRWLGYRERADAEHPDRVYIVRSILRRNRQPAAVPT